MARSFSTRVIFEAVDRITGPIGGINRKIEDLSKRASFASKAASGFGRTIGAITGPVGALAGGAGIAGAAAAITRFTKQADEIAKFSRQVGVSTEALQAWRHSSELVGVGADKFNDSLKQFSIRLGQARAGTGPLVSAFAKTNPAFLEQLKAANSTEEALSLYIAEMKKVENPTDRAVIAAAGFSEGNLEMARFAEATAEELANQRAEAIALGLVTGDAATASERFNDGMTRLQAAVGGVSNIILSKLVPVLADAIEYVVGFIQRNQELVQWASMVVGAAAAMAATVATVGFAFSQVAGPIQAIAGLVNGPLLGAFKALAGFLIANPIVAAIAAIGAAVYIIYDNWDGIVAWFQQKIGAVANAFDQGFLQGITEILYQFNPYTIVAQAIDGLIEYLFGIDLYDAGMKMLSSFISGIQSVLPNLSAIGDRVSGFLDRLNPFSDSAEDPAISAAASAASADGGLGAAANVNSRIDVNVANAPPGTTVEATSSAPSTRVNRRASRGPSTVGAAG